MKLGCSFGSFWETSTVTIFAITLAASSCQNACVKNTSGLRAPSTNANEAAQQSPTPPKPLFVVLGGYGTCRGITSSPFNGNPDIVSPFNGAQMGGMWKEHFSTDGDDHAVRSLRAFRDNLLNEDDTVEFWKEKKEANSIVYGCHSYHTDPGTHQFAWWENYNFQSNYKDETKLPERYKLMGFRSMVLKTPTTINFTTPEEPYPPAALAAFAQDVVNAARALNPQNNLRPIYIMGHSMGAYMGMRLAEAIFADNGLRSSVQILGILTADAVSPGVCPGTQGLWYRAFSQRFFQQCALFPPEFSASRGQTLRKNLDATAQSIGLDKLPNFRWFNYYQNSSTLHSDRAVYAHYNRHVLYTDRFLTSIPLIGAITQGVEAANGALAHMVMADEPAIWLWRPQNQSHWIPWVKDYTVGIDALMGWRMRIDGIALRTNVDAAIAWQWSQPAPSTGKFQLDGPLFNEGFPTLAEQFIKSTNNWNRAKEFVKARAGTLCSELNNTKKNQYGVSRELTTWGCIYPPRTPARTLPMADPSGSDDAVHVPSFDGFMLIESEGHEIQTVEETTTIDVRTP